MKNILKAASLAFIFLILTAKPSYATQNQIVIGYVKAQKYVPIIVLDPVKKKLAPALESVGFKDLNGPLAEAFPTTAVKIENFILSKDELNGGSTYVADLPNNAKMTKKNHFIKYAVKIAIPLHGMNRRKKT